MEGDSYDSFHFLCGADKSCFYTLATVVYDDIFIIKAKIILKIYSFQPLDHASLNFRIRHKDPF